MRKIGECQERTSPFHAANGLLVPHAERDAAGPVRDGWVVRLPSADRRAVAFHVAKLGELACAGILGDRQRRIARTLGVLSREERESLGEIAEKFSRARSRSRPGPARPAVCAMPKRVKAPRPILALTCAKSQTLSGTHAARRCLAAGAANVGSALRFIHVDEGANRALRAHRRQSSSCQVLAHPPSACQLPDHPHLSDSCHPRRTSTGELACPTTARHPKPLRL